MPVCRLFLRGMCLEPACAFAHVHLGAAAACRSFARCGYCDAGAACELRHEQSCDAYAAHGSCALGERCKLRRSRGARLPDSVRDGMGDRVGGGSGGRHASRMLAAAADDYDDDDDDDGGGGDDDGCGSSGGDGGGQGGGSGDNDAGWELRGGRRERHAAIFGRDSFSVAPPIARDSSICPQLDSPVAISAVRRESSEWS